MNLLAIVALVVLVENGKPADPAKQPPTVAEELQRFQGTWQLEAWEEGGKPLPAADLTKRGVFIGANILVLRKDGKVFQAGALQLDPSKMPCTVNLSVKEGEGKDGVLLGIYSLEGDSLKLCFDPQGQSRPENFKPEAKAGFTMIIVKKPKPPADETVEIVGKYRSVLTDATTGKVTVADVLVERRGDAYSVNYRVDDKVLFVGMAIRKGDQLSMCWASAGQAGVSVYKIEAGPKLVGDYTILGGIGVTGKEVLTKWKKTD